ncbi:uncharacterized protein METZ01_LOCUS286838 [marine metagenome]|uniref:Uncharacterized protein n=1 Tax=marine metagenome TaxID=408172 RepID=A0A382LAR0_9ZZZZ
MGIYISESPQNAFCYEFVKSIRLPSSPQPESLY